MTDTIRVFVGCAANFEDIESQAVLEWSIRKRASLSVEITWMKLSRDVSSPFYSGPGVTHGWDTRTWATPFSGLRWAIPELCGYQGKAIYMDSDVIVTADLAALWRQEHQPGSMLIAKGGGAWRICVSMFDCAEARKHLPDPRTMRQDMHAHKKLCALIRDKAGLVQAFEGEWNCLDKEIGSRPVDHPSIKAIHYTDMRSQPQLRHALPRLAAEGREHWHDGKKMIGQFPAIDALFDELLDEAKANGYPPERYIDSAPYGRYVKKSLAA